MSQKKKIQKALRKDVAAPGTFSGDTKQRKYHFFTFLDFNHVVQTLIFSEVLLLGAFGLLAPTFAIFIGESISGDPIKTASIATTVYLLTRSLGQIPIGMMIDRAKGERDDLLAMVLGTLFAGFVPLLYMVISTPMQLYMTQFLYGLASALVFPAWMATFTRHIDVRHEGAEWGAYRSFVDLSMALAALVGGYIAVRYNFQLVFLIVSVVTFFAAFHLLSLRSLARKHGGHGEI